MLGNGSQHSPLLISATYTKSMQISLCHTCTTTYDHMFICFYKKKQIYLPFVQNYQESRKNCAEVRNSLLGDPLAALSTHHLQTVKKTLLSTFFCRIIHCFA